MVVAGLAIAGCGGSSTRSSTGTSDGQLRSSSARQHTSSQAEPVPSASINVSIPALLREEFIPRRYTCDGTDVSLPVQWNGVPPGAAEVAMFVVNLRPVHGRLFFDWAVVGLKPTSHGIPGATLPAGAVVGRNSFGNVGYSICPPRGTREEHFIVRVFALARPLPVRIGFDAEALFHQALRSPQANGGAAGVYSRP
ncbi:MAG: YbhB/YbcL family Raf kinase inhibitor-like protein [Solirubrobacteraceae bacterium]